MFIRPANRWQAFGIHIVVSVFLFLVLASIIYFFWYPGLLFHYDGGLEGIKLIAGVDFFIGPVLTLCVYKVGKKSLPFDLSVIAALQAACLAGGMWTVWQTHPAAVVYADGFFRSVSYQTFKDYGVEPKQVKLLQTLRPTWIAVDMPPEELAKWRKKSAVAGMVDPDLFFQTNYYVPLQAAQKDIAQAGKKSTEILGFPVDRANESYLQGENIRYYYAGLGAGAGYMAVDISTVAPVGFVVQMDREKSLLERVRQVEVALMKLIDSLR
ncbi:MAG: hypothetical protein R3E63_02950 [Pseudomonadales bacterium]